MSIDSRRQQGVVLIVTLIVLVVMTMGAIAMVRSMDTTTLIAGNLAFRQSATYSGDVGVETAIAWVQTQSTTQLELDNATMAYSAGGSGNTPPAGTTWDQYWTATLAPGARTLAADANGNTVAYVVHRLCATPGARTAVGVNCVVSPATTAAAGSSKTAGAVGLTAAAQVYYRITARIAGPRGSASYIQAVIAF